MNTISHIEFCGKQLPFEEQALDAFKTYTDSLKNHFYSLEDGKEIYNDLEFRILEILESRLNGKSALTEEDVKILIGIIGDPQELKEEIHGGEEFYYTENRKLYRNNKDKVIAGVAGGLGNYFALDPLAFRLLFSLITLISFGLGILTYIVMWIILVPKDLEPNYSRRLYRSEEDKIIAGVCGGLARFFKIETWIVRLLFVLPLILSLFNFGFINSGILRISIGGSGIGFSIITYFILWFSTNYPNSKTEKMLSKGESVNINSLSGSKTQNTVETNSGLNNILRVFAYVLITMILIALIPTFFGLSVASLFVYPMMSSILHTAFMKWLAWLTIFFFLLLPVVAFIIWGIRKIAGYKRNKKLRLAFGGLWMVGLTSAIILTVLLFKELNTVSYISNLNQIPVNGDTLYVKSLNDFNDHKTHYRSLSLVNVLYDGGKTSSRSYIVDVDIRESKDTNFYVKTILKSQGRNRGNSAANAKHTLYKSEFIDGNTMYIPNYVEFPKTEPFRFQRAKVIFYVPRNKEIDMNDYHHAFEGFGQNIVIRNSRGKKYIHIRTDDNAFSIIEDAQDDINEARKDIKESMEELKKDFRDSEEEDVQDRIRNAERKSKLERKIAEERLEMEKSRIRLEELERKLNEREE